ncbi:hypothetical protein [Candidatus Neptunochlamydia vexilliferae]|uniref:Uncharacterized protein n=1 Tax=Candidatus Neptunichlamydia vexilliferae TaxID=1651774 RepID=A0ABS0AZ18_9BACT|nr:hypothetical protein [Candidatus Neptunochlamydia vexilliferae]MBF5059369.1 hypothetical protein [Candidatus Neptunochlamydia vexilliferae]
MADNFPEKIGSTSNIDPAKGIQPGDKHLPQPTESFESYMKESGPEGSGDAKTEGPTPFDLAAQGKPVQPGAGPTHETIAAQMNSNSSVLGDLQTQLTNKDLKLRQSQKYLLRNKLSSANQNIRTAAKKTGAETGPPVAKFSRQSPVNKFLGLVTDSQTQLAEAQSRINKLNMSGKSLNPGEMLTIQVKLAKAQQELEYSSVLLSTATSDIKTLFNIQL